MSSEEFREGMRYRLRASATGKVVISQQPDISLCSLLLCWEQWEDWGISAKSILTRSRKIKLTASVVFWQ